MLKLVSKDEYERIIDDLNRTKVETRFKNGIKERRGHKDFFFLTMISEDGNGTLQGIASSEVYKTRIGNIASINTLWVNPNCRGNRYGEILIFHLERLINEKYPIYSFVSNGNKAALKSFLKNGFDSNDKEKTTIRLFKSENI